MVIFHSYVNVYQRVLFLDEQILRLMFFKIQIYFSKQNLRIEDFSNMELEIVGSGGCLAMLELVNIPVVPMVLLDIHCQPCDTLPFLSCMYLDMYVRINCNKLSCTK